MSSVYHEGEQYIQELMNVREKSESLSSMFKKNMPEEASLFLKSLNFCVLTFVKNKNELHSCVVYSHTSFIKVINSNEILITLDEKSFLPKSIIDEKELSIAFLGLNFERAMRIRINARAKINNKELHLKINEVYANCPQYINNRKIVKKINFLDTSKLENHFFLEKKCENIIKNSDTFFIASSHKNKGADISHKGGAKGFLKICSKSEIQFDDYSGNNMYNTLGNIHTNPNISLLIIDFLNNDVLHIRGTAKIIKDKYEKKLKVSIECKNISIESNIFSLKYDK